MGNNVSSDSLGCATNYDPDCRPCEVELDDIDTWNYLFYASLAISILFVIVFRSVATKRENMHKLPTFCCGFGIFKAVLAIVLFAKQPDTAPCKNFANASPSTSGFWLYPVIMMLLAFSWFSRARRFQQVLADQGHAPLVVVVPSAVMAGNPMAAGQAQPYGVVPVATAVPNGYN